MQYPANYRHVAEQVYAGGAPTPDMITDLTKSLGLKYVLSLDNSDGTKITPTLSSLKVQQIFIPIEPVGYMTDNLKYLIRNIQNVIGSHQPIYIHCTHGQDRTGFVIALYRVMKFKWSADAAIAEARRFGYGLGVSPQTQVFWKNILTTLATAKNPADVGAVSDGLGVYITYPSGNVGTIPMDYPYQQSVPENKNIYLLEKMLSDTDSVPLVGIYNNDGPIKGSGPVEALGYDLYTTPNG